MRGWSLGLCAGMLLSCSLARDLDRLDLEAVTCDGDQTCQAEAGFGSTCVEGVCTEAARCTDSFDCREAVGIGAHCAGGVCEAAPLDPRCVRSVPPELIDELPGSLGDRIVLGGMFRLDTPGDDARATAAELAIEEINVAGGIQGRRFGLLLCNNDSDGNGDNDLQETAELTEYLGGQLGVPAIIGPSFSSHAIEAIATFTSLELDVAVISHSATSVQLTSIFDRLDASDPYGLFWRTAPSDALQGKRLATLIAERPTLSRVAVIFKQDSYGSGVREAFRTAFNALDAAHTVESFPILIGDAASEEANIESAVSEAVAMNPHAVVVVTETERTLVVLQKAAGTPLELLPFFLTDSSKDADPLLSSGDATITPILQNALGTSPANPQDGSFVEDYNAFASQQRGKNIDARDFAFTAHAYDAAYVAAYGAAYASRQHQTMTGRRLVEGMSQLSNGEGIVVGGAEWPDAVNRLGRAGGSVDIEGASGPLDFDPETGEAPGPIEVWKVNDNFDGFDIQGEPVIPE